MTRYYMPLSFEVRKSEQIKSEVRITDDGSNGCSTLYCAYIPRVGRYLPTAVSVSPSVQTTSIVNAYYIDTYIYRFIIIFQLYS